MGGFAIGSTALRARLNLYLLPLFSLFGLEDGTLSIFQPGSTKPASILYEALEHYQRKSPKADENIRVIKPDLAEAVDTCIEAAGQEWDAKWQQKLLRVSPL